MLAGAKIATPVTLTAVGKRCRGKPDLTLGFGRQHLQLTPGAHGGQKYMAMDGNTPQTRRRFLVAILGGAAAVMLVGAPESADAATAAERREARRKRRAERRAARQARKRRREKM